MGIYVFSWDKLKYYLETDDKNDKSSKDFGKDVIPSMLDDQQKLVCYRYSDYWKDVGTIDSLWEANLDLLNPKVELDLSDPDWKIYSATPSSSAQYIAQCANVQNSLITEGCEISGDIEYSVIFENVIIEPGATVEYSIIMPGAKICKDANSNPHWFL